MIKQLFMILIGLLGLLYGWTILSLFSDLSLLVPARETGIWLGRASIVVYFLTLVPGIARRLRFGVKEALPLMIYRRQLGVLMFWLALGHWLFLTLLPTLMFNLPILLDAPRLVGLTSLVILTPLWLTSNDFAQRRLGKKWRYLHNFTHAVVGLLFLHVALFARVIAILAAVFLLLDSLSWAVEWRRRLGSRVAPNQPPPQPPA